MDRTPPNTELHSQLLCCCKNRHSKGWQGILTTQYEGRERLQEGQCEAG